MYNDPRSRRWFLGLGAAWSAAVEQPAYITTTVADILGTAPRTFRQWAADHATAFTEGSEGS